MESRGQDTPRPPRSQFLLVDRLDAYRARHGLTVDDLARELGIPISEYLRLMLLPQPWTLPDVHFIAMRFGVPTSLLAGMIFE
jgi:hypothetical protein